MSSIAISAFAPLVSAKSIFACRRAKKSQDADNAPVSIMNGCVAAAQLAKAGEGIIGIAHDSKGSVAEKIVNIDNALREIPKTEKMFQGASQVARYGMEHINGLIGATAAIKALCSEDKESAFIQEGLAVAGMLGCENAHKAIFGCSKSKFIDGESEIRMEKGLYREVPLLSHTADKFKEYCSKESEILSECKGIKKLAGKALKCAPSGIKGISFAMTSIAGFAGFHALGGLAAEAVTGRECA